MKSNFHNILVIRQAALGDVANILPLLQVIRDAYPQARLSVLTGRVTAPLLADDPCVDEVLVFDRTLRPLRLLPMMWRLMRRRFDLVVDFQSSRCTWWLAMATMAGLRIGSKGFPFYNRKISVDITTMQACSVFREFLVPLGLGQAGMSPRFPGLDQADAEAKAVLRDAKVVSPYVVFNPGHSPAWATKRWPQAHWAALAGMARDAGLNVVLSGGPAERPLTEVILEEIGPAKGVFNLAGQTTLRQLAGVMHNAAAVVSTDSGPMHVAAMAGAKVVALFGPTHQLTSGPFGPGHQVMHHKLHCSYCFKKVCPYNHECLDEMMPEEVWQAVQKILAESSERSDDVA